MELFLLMLCVCVCIVDANLRMLIQFWEVPFNQSSRKLNWTNFWMFSSFTFCALTPFWSRKEIHHKCTYIYKMTWPQDPENSVKYFSLFYAVVPIPISNKVYLFIIISYFISLRTQKKNMKDALLWMKKYENLLQIQFEMAFYIYCFNILSQYAYYFPIHVCISIYVHTSTYYGNNTFGDKGLMYMTLCCSKFIINKI